ncbi:thiamine phosphate synthase [Methylobacterium brachythecii]|uniref:Thiamine-phosphate pyrophosphorylase n=1 Tax=Methylobacterium brachythecii TaxID=1176177 RepID=A0A7W6F6E3_9HYPH|nr:thiamine phosphate synthase [Methylobacterium brachythecii]MBB3902255.1 thiamine-phosphate pyrophosphorylase [Methylobacterium brachythecii]GLS42101.1 thiamine-phosphate synthase [Methylobacterium brachythecii]
MIPAPLLVVTDRHGAHRPLTDTVRAVLEGGARWIWFRDKDLEPEARRDLVAELLRLVHEAGGCLTIGGNACLAAEIGADGVHLGGSVFSTAAPTVIASEAKQSRNPQRSTGEAGLLRFARNDGGEDNALAALPETVAAARYALKPGALVGLSAHSLADIRSATAAGADYVTFSPIFATASKPGYGPSLGLDALREAAGLGLPIIALGGIGVDEARRCREAGAAGVAVMGGLMRASDPAAETHQLLAALSAPPPTPSS